ncbi:MAG: SLBB domain-containing protein [Bacteroidota bacterium]|nr:SLBB domain-containing protein [Bacteroidota bacterium]
MNQLDQYATAKGASKEEIAKLKKRIVKYNDKLGGAKKRISTSDENQMPEEFRFDPEKAKYYEAYLAKQDSIKAAKPKIFGASIFNDVNLSFEPNLRLATPQNYILGPDDELLIDVYGVSEVSHKVNVSPEGNIRIPNVGVISVGGLTIEEAKKIIKSRLARVYGGISAGNTFVSIALGDIRSITVNVIGEIVYPGSYTIPSLATVFNALYQSGGPKESGSFRDIQVIRNSKVIATIDLYDFLVYGKQSNLRLHDQDAIKVLPYRNRVTITGEVKNPAIFEMKPGETLKELIEFAGGFTEKAYRERITANRNTLKEKSVIDIAYDEFKIFKTEPGDEYKVGEILNRYTNRVQIAGAVYRPGAYALTKDMNLRTLLEKADGLKEDAFVNSATIFRKNATGLPEMTTFCPKDILEGKSTILLQREDSIFISSVLDLKEKEFVYISGEVMNPGRFPFADGMSLKDIILMSNGFKNTANVGEIEIYRQITDENILNKNINKAESFKIQMDKNLSLEQTASFKLKREDRVMIRPIFGFENMKDVKIEGEVRSAGSYVITSKNQRISDLIKLAGGLTNYAYPEGAFLIRKLESNESQKKLLEDISGSISSKVIKKGNEIDSLRVKKEILNETQTVAINLEKILKKPGSDYDLKLEAGDVLSIPKSLETVTINGEVLRPNTVRYQKGKSFGFYVNNAGGYSTNAKTSKSYIIHANGSVEVTTCFLGLKFYPKVKPGSRIIVPEKPVRKSMTTAETVAISTSLVSVLAILLSVIKSF